MCGGTITCSVRSIQHYILTPHTALNFRQVRGEILMIWMVFCSTTAAFTRGPISTISWTINESSSKVYHCLLAASPLPSILMCPPSIHQSKRRWHSGRFSRQDRRPDSTHVKQGEEEKSPINKRHPRTEMTIVKYGFQSAEQPGLWAVVELDSRDPIKSVSLTLSAAIKEEVNISIYYVHHI